MDIGKFTKKGDGKFTGVIDTLDRKITTTFAPHDGGGIDYRIMTDLGSELGVAWNKTSGDGKSFLSVKLDSPFLPNPVNCAMFKRDDNTYALVWDRPKKTKKPAEG